MTMRNLHSRKKKRAKVSVKRVLRGAQMMAYACGSLWENVPERKRPLFLKCARAALEA